MADLGPTSRSGSGFERPLLKWLVMLSSGLVAIWALLGDTRLEDLGLPPLPVPESMLLALLIWPLSTLLVIAYRPGRPWAPRTSGLLVPAILTLLGLMAISSLWSVGLQPIYATYFLPQLATLIIVCLGVWTIAGTDFERFAATFASVSLVLGGGVVLLGLSGLWGSPREGALGIGSNVFARIAALSALSAIYLIASGRISRIGVAYVAIASVGLLATGSRGGLIAFALSALLALVLYRRHLTLGSILVGLSAGLICGLAIVTFTGAGEGALSVFDDRIVSQTIEGRYLAGRDLHLDVSRELFLQQPWLGNGIGGYSAFWGYREYPHNMVAEVAVSVGVLGLSLLVLILGLLTRQIWITRRNLAANYAATVIVLYFVASLASGWTYDARIFWLFGVALGAFGASQQPNVAESGMNRNQIESKVVTGKAVTHAPTTRAESN